MFGSFCQNLSIRLFGFVLPFFAQGMQADGVERRPRRTRAINTKRLFFGSLLDLTHEGAQRLLAARHGPSFIALEPLDLRQPFEHYSRARVVIDDRRSTERERRERPPGDPWQQMLSSMEGEAIQDGTTTCSARQSKTFLNGEAPAFLRQLLLLLSSSNFPRIRVRRIIKK